jgi:hypothetical protein
VLAGDQGVLDVAESQTHQHCWVQISKDLGGCMKGAACIHFSNVSVLVFYLFIYHFFTEGAAWSHFSNVSALVFFLKKISKKGAARVIFEKSAP